MSADWLYRYGDEVREVRFYEAVKLIPFAGSAPGGVADGYQEFWWGVVLLFLFIGRSYSTLWKQHKMVGGFWTIIFVAGLITSIYFITQSVTAAFVRMLFITGCTFVAWRLWLKLPISYYGARMRSSPRV
jgi:hypothetical protein